MGGVINVVALGGKLSVSGSSVSLLPPIKIPRLPPHSTLTVAWHGEVPSPEDCPPTFTQATTKTTAPASLQPLCTTQDPAVPSALSPDICPALPSMEWGGAVLQDSGPTLLHSWESWPGIGGESRGDSRFLGDV